MPDTGPGRAEAPTPTLSISIFQNLALSSPFWVGSSHLSDSEASINKWKDIQHSGDNSQDDRPADDRYATRSGLSSTSHS
jgi:hypothetical protein